MHQTTVRFGTDLWEALESECQELGVSVAQFVREAALTRLVYIAARAGDTEFEHALDLVAGAAPPDVAALPADLEALVAPATPGQSAHERARTEAAESEAIWAQAQQARRRAGELRHEIAARRQDIEARWRDNADAESSRD
jgi:hypothetical protein